MIKKCMSLLFLVSIGLPLYGMHEPKNKKTIYSLEQLKGEYGRARQEVQKDRTAALEDMVTRSKMEKTPEVKVMIETIDKK